MVYVVAGMSMIRCDGCGQIGDCKDEWIEGFFEDAKPWRFWCPSCAQDFEDDSLRHAMETQDPALYKELTDE